MYVVRGDPYGHLYSVMRLMGGRSRVHCLNILHIRPDTRMMLS
jgi:hypothetical protein